MKSTATVSYGIRNLTEYRVLFIGKYTITEPRTAYFRNDGGITFRTVDPHNSVTFDDLGGVVVYGIKHDSIMPGQVVLVD